MILFLLFTLISSACGSDYSASWQLLDGRPLPRWYDEAKVGVMVHWGVFSVPSCCGASQWFLANWKHGNEDVIKYMRENYPPGFTYQDFGRKFTADLFDPDKWAKLFKRVGAKYVILTSKSQDGFALFPSKSTSWNSVSTGPHRDLVGELDKAVRGQGLKFGIYYSLIEMVNDTYNSDSNPVKFKSAYRADKLWPEMKQLVHRYKPSVIWADSHSEATDSYLNSTQLLAWLYNMSPVRHEVVVNDRWGVDTQCKHGDFHTCKNSAVTLQKHKWESIQSIDTISSGFRRDMEIEDLLNVQQILRKIVTTVSCGGNILINIGATQEGTIPLIFQDRLLAVGEWMAINGEAIYGTSPWLHQQDSLDNDVWYTCTRSAYDGFHPTATPQLFEIVISIYAIILKWPPKDLLKLRDVAPYFHGNLAQVEMLGNNEEIDYLKWFTSGENIMINLPRHKVKSKYAWTLKITSNRRGIF